MKLSLCDWLAQLRQLAEPEDETILRDSVRDHPGIAQSATAPFLPDYWYVYPVEWGQCNMTEYTVSSPGRKLSEGNLSEGELSEGNLSEGKLSEGESKQ